MEGVSLPRKVDAEPRKTPGFLASEGEEFNPGPETKLDRSELLCNKVLLKYKREKASDIDIRRGRKSAPLLVLARESYTFSLVVTMNQKNVWRW